jgi:hypothetical protein
MPDKSCKPNVQYAVCCTLGGCFSAHRGEFGEVVVLAILVLHSALGRLEKLYVRKLIYLEAKAVKGTFENRAAIKELCTL